MQEVEQQEKSEFRISRVDVEPTEENLKNLLVSNPIGRNRDLRELIDLLHRIDGPYTLFLDGAWGTGKTVFAKQLQIVLEKLNQQLTSDADAESFFEQLPGFEGLSEGGEGNEGAGIIPVYYNAWENDYWPHPLPSLGAALAFAAGDQFDPKSDSPSSKAIRKISEGVGNLLGAIGGVPGAGTAGAKVVEALSGERILAAYQSEKILRQAVRELVEAVKKEQGGRVLLVVDELDRCKPSFALEMLEVTKTLFDHPDVIVLYVLNEEALAHMVEKEYGTGVTGTDYLRKFYDRRIVLPKAEAKSYQAHLRNVESAVAFNEISVHLAEQFGMTLRDMNRWVARLDLIVAGFEKAGKPRQSVLLQMLFVIVPLLNAIELMKPNDYKAIRDNLDGTKLWSYLEANGELVGILHWACQQARAFSPEEMGEDFCKAACQVLWNHDDGSKNRQDALEFLRNLQFDWPRGLGALSALVP